MTASTRPVVPSADTVSPGEASQIDDATTFECGSGHFHPVQSDFSGIFEGSRPPVPRSNNLASRLIRWYQRRISPMFGPRCKFYPTCSSYALGAIDEHGVLKGFLLGAWRLLRCNPFSNGGVDDVPASFKLRFRAHVRWPIGDQDCPSRMSAQAPKE